VRVTFLLGSGISRDAGFPGVVDLTRAVLASPPAHPGQRPTRVADLIDSVQRHICRELPNPSYEDLAATIQQLVDALSSEYESPAVLPYARQVAGDLELDKESLHDLCDRALDQIAGTVARNLLGGDLSRVAHLIPIVRCCRELERIDLATLNHDRLLESALNAEEVPFADGFEPSGRELRVWADDWSSASVRLLKLHGSIDWYDVRDATSASMAWRSVNYTGNDVEHLPRGLDVRSPLPTFLTGTLTKILAYQTGIFPDVHTRFLEGLREAHRVIAIGYGFRDKAINSQLIAWMARRSTNRLIVCHPRPTDLRSGARPAVARWWDEWHAAGRIDVVPHYMNKITTDDLRAVLDA
jgi:hypothetical protein